jgi:hypothetical protein
MVVGVVVELWWEDWWWRLGGGGGGDRVCWHSLYLLFFAFLHLQWQIDRKIVEDVHQMTTGWNRTRVTAIRTVP